MIHISRTVCSLASITLCGALALPSFAQVTMTTKTSSTRLSGKTMSKAAADNMMLRKMMSGATAAERRTYAAMSAAEKALCLKMCWKVSGGKLSVKPNSTKTSATR